MQVLIVKEEAYLEGYDFYRRSNIDTREECLENVKRDRIVIAEILLSAGSRRGARFFGKAKLGTLPDGRCPSDSEDLSSDDSSEGRVDMIDDDGVREDDLEEPLDLVKLMAGQNLSSGGPEVEALLSSVWPSPRSLLSSCRIAVRRSLTRPILLTGNVSTLPIPPRVKVYVAMETLEMSQS